MRRAKSLRNDVHHANGVVWGPVYRTHLSRGRHRTSRNPGPSYRADDDAGEDDAAASSAASSGGATTMSERMRSTLRRVTAALERSCSGRGPPSGRRRASSR